MPPTSNEKFVWGAELLEAAPLQFSVAVGIGMSSSGGIDGGMDATSSSSSSSSSNRKMVSHATASARDYTLVPLELPSGGEMDLGVAHETSAGSWERGVVVGEALARDGVSSSAEVDGVGNDRQGILDYQTLVPETSPPAPPHHSSYEHKGARKRGSAHAAATAAPAVVAPHPHAGRVLAPTSGESVPRRGFEVQQHQHVDLEEELTQAGVHEAKREMEALRQERQPQGREAAGVSVLPEADENAENLVTTATTTDQAPFACPPGSGGSPSTSHADETGVPALCNSDPSGSNSASSVSLAHAEATNTISEEGLPAVVVASSSFMKLSEEDSYGLEGGTAVIASPEVLGGVRSDLPTVRQGILPLSGVGGGGVGARDIGRGRGDFGMIGGALHVALAFAVLLLVVFSKTDYGAVRVNSYGKGAGSNTGGSGSGSSTDPRRRGSNSSGGNGSGGGGSAQRGAGGAGPAKRRRISTSNKRGGGRWAAFSSLSVLRHLMSAGSKLWHLVENDVATRWHAAGQMLASLRQAWSALWMPPPHSEADVLAEALASPPRYFQGAAGRHGRTDGASGSGGVGSAGGFPERRKRRSGRTSSSSSRGGGGRPLSGVVPNSSSSERGLNLGRPVGLNCLNFLSLCGYHPGGKKGSRQPKFLLLLDLDETLVHCSPHLMEPARRRGRGGGERGKSLRPDLKLEMRGRAPSDNRPSSIYAWKRPHLDIFLSVVSRWYEVAIFTSGQRCFAEPLIDLIDSRCVIGKRFYRDSCVRRDKSAAGGTGAAKEVAAGAGAGLATGSPAGSETVKDLRVVGSEEHFPRRTVLVDNQPRTVVQQANVLPVKSWFPRDSEDRQLLDLLPVLLALTSCQDVRSVLGLRPGVGGVGGR